MSAKVTELHFGERREYQPRTGLAAVMERDAGILASNFPNDLSGFVMVAVNSKGEWALAAKHNPQTLLGPTMLAGLAIQAIQREIVTEGAIKDAIIRNGLVQPDPEQK